jgi:transcriptional regulator with XRE-family HTH domain
MAGGSDKNGDEGRLAFGRRVRYLREAAGMSQEALADRAGLHRTYVSSLERGKRNVGLDNILGLARALGVPPAVLFEADG